MREFSKPGWRLAQLSREVKWVYTGFLLFVGLGLCTNGLFQVTRIGLTLDRIAMYYRGGELEQSMTFPKTFAQLLELTHFHTFLMGIIFLILAHLLIATALSPWLKTSLIILACAGSLGDIASYWLIRYASPVFAVLQLLSWIGMWIGYGGMLVITLWDMWCMP
jgi:hypothetical protein